LLRRLYAVVRFIFLFLMKGKKGGIFPLGKSRGTARVVQHLTAMAVVSWFQHDHQQDKQHEDKLKVVKSPPKAHRNILLSMVVASLYAGIAGTAWTLVFLMCARIP
jgi:hypothetical protein